MENEYFYAVSKLKDAVSRLRQGILQASSELEKDGVIQRFEFTFELLWKTLKIFLAKEGLEVKSPRDALQTAFKLGWISEEEIFLNMLLDRNKMAHIYNKQEVETIFLSIKTKYALGIEQLVRKSEQLL